MKTYLGLAIFALVCVGGITAARTPTVKCYNIIKEFEGCRLTAYLDPVGIWTIGWGTIQYPNGTRVRQGDVITQAQADYCLEYEVDEKARSVDASIGTGVVVNTNQFDACVSFAYNVGTQAFHDSTLLRKLKVNPNDPTIRDEFMRWVYGGGEVLPGLVRRREAEANLYFTPV